MLMFDKIRSKVGKKAHDAKILIKIKSKGFAMSRKITYFAPLPRNRCLTLHRFRAIAVKKSYLVCCVGYDQTI